MGLDGRRGHRGKPVSADAVRHLMDTALGPWGGPASVIDAYEAAIRATAEAQLGVARTIDVQPVRAVAALWADFTRDVGAVQVSGARWVLDV
jgi:hypothetical protein